MPLDVAEVELQRIAEHQEENTTGNVTEYQPNVVMLGLSPSNYVLRAFTNIHTNDLEQALLALPFSDGLKLLSYFKDWTSNPDKVELVCRVTTVLLQTHYNQLVTTPAARPVLTLLKDILYERVKESKDTLGFNLAAMDHLKIRCTL
uniref:Small-subunit processome Utp12 domain-containing protein n=1 Tax=Salix viminalis TaxID=40686 RepID=A0A6N2KG93_SALVM